ncbi:MAG TPA: hypothetical protein VFI31_29925 [Pirellulales bacterium]|nr:hypothetical protein [Pirellulales bacterium]
MPISLTGVVRGNTIEFQGGLGLPEGQVVTVTFQAVSGAQPDTNEQLAATFLKLVEEWKNATGHLSNISQKVKHPAYQAIIAMGKPVVPLILRELEAEPNDWFVALTRITGEDPVPEVSYGVVNQMTSAWLRWGKSQGYVW